MGKLDGFFKKKPKEAENNEVGEVKEQLALVHQKIYEMLKENNQPEKAIIHYILTQSKNNELVFATKDGGTYVYFTNNEISNFLNDWFVVVSAYQNGKLSPTMYGDCMNTMLNKYSLELKKTENKTE